MRKTTVVNRYRHTADPDEPERDVDITRGTQWGNPYPLASRTDRDVVTCLLAYARHLDDVMDFDTRTFRAGLIGQVRWLRGHTLVCVCAPARCHGDILARCADVEDARAELRTIIAELEAELALIDTQGVLL